MKKCRQLQFSTRIKKQMLLCCALVMCINPIKIVGNENRVYAAGNEEYYEKARSAKEILEVIEGIFQWKKTQEGINEDAPLMSGEVLQYAGTSSYDWYALAIGRCGYEDDYESYVHAMKQQIIEKYQTADKLDANRSTEWHRQILTLLALGEDPADIQDSSGNCINLVADGTYYRSRTMNLGEQGINGYIWALLALDSMRYQVPDDATDTRESMITAILNSQGTDGGFFMVEGISDVDITAMALQALAPYYDSETEYELEPQEGISNIRTVGESIDLALDYLSSCQKKDGTMKNGSDATAETTAQVITALSCLEIDLQTDERFIKDGKTLLDGMLSFRNPDGGFSHLLTEEERESNSLVGEQTACALTAYVRFCLGESSIYDFRTRMKEADQEPVEQLGEEIFSEYEMIQKEIDEINAEVQTHLYPFENLKEEDRKQAAAIVKRLETMPEYAKEQILEYDRLYEAARNSKPKNGLESIVPVIVVSVITITGATIVIIARNNNKKAREEDDWNEE